MENPKINRDDSTTLFWNGLSQEIEKKQESAEKIGNNCNHFISVDKMLLFTAMCMTLFIF